ncbi:hypothetical protein [uncultured Shewanella sp.]|uniref:hypothetical protein n=1 Tax=uncultured Shewanella sp. TaxID=173975 RepID=UPI0026031769|nr:hypothetical protein [uncultured Shewanella sp.]
MSKSNREQMWANQKAEHYSRYLRCKQKTATRNRNLIKNWLDSLDPTERELSRTTLNNMRISRNNKRDNSCK